MKSDSLVNLELAHFKLQNKLHHDYSRQVNQNKIRIIKISSTFKQYFSGLSNDGVFKRQLLSDQRVV